MFESDLAQRLDRVVRAVRADGGVEVPRIDLHVDVDPEARCATSSASG